MNTLVVGGGGRESAIAASLAKDGVVYAVAPHYNPSLLRYTQATHGRFLRAHHTEQKAIIQFAQANRVDLAFISADEPLAAGLVDALLASGIRTVGPTRAGAQIEWDKHYALDLMRQIWPGYTPRFWVVRDTTDLEAAIDEITSLRMDIVVKPQGLTGGKGVKVMGPHLADMTAAKRYTLELLASHPGESVEMVEKLTGPEFTVMALTDGEHVVMPPCTYDHPYRYTGDRGPGTGGMGAFTTQAPELPFMTTSQYAECEYIIQGVVDELCRRGLHYNGVLNAGFFATPTGLKFMEFNARFGDPECMNILCTLATPLSEVLNHIAAGSLSGDRVRFHRLASVVKYLVSPDYALREGREYRFHLDSAEIERHGVGVFFAASEQVDGDLNAYRTIGNSRCVALAATDDSIPAAAGRIEAALASYFKGPLEWRADIGSEHYLRDMLHTTQGGSS